MKNRITPKQDRHYREFCSGIMMRYGEKGKWSPEELDVKAYLESVGFKNGETYWHNYKMQTPEQTNFYTLDFFIPMLNLVIECDGEAWHGQMGNADLKDIVRDNWLRFLGLHTIRIHEVKELEGIFNVER